MKPRLYTIILEGAVYILHRMYVSRRRVVGGRGRWCRFVKPASRTCTAGPTPGFRHPASRAAAVQWVITRVLFLSADVSFEVCHYGALKNAPPPTTRQAHLPYGSSHRRTGSIGLALAAAAPCALRSCPVARCSCLQAHPRRTPQRRCGARGRLRHRTCIGCDGRAVPSWTAAGRFRRRRECTSPPAQGDRVDCDHRCRLRRNAH